ncbi:hypothetical protein ACFVGY_33830 [Streptomyces sp. NPDC127106]|uniref:hypothetical protein n=1 Tax=Streptomyces sp. NPDC127106 TaxID=3345360 RepID=UPI0036298F0F
MSIRSVLLRTLILLAVESGAVLLLLRGPVPWIPVLLAVFVVGSGVLHGTDAEFTSRFAVALAAVGVAELTVRAWGPVPDPRATAAGLGAAVLLVVQTAAVARYARRPRPRRRRA